MEMASLVRPGLVVRAWRRPPSLTRSAYAAPPFHQTLESACRPVDRVTLTVVVGRSKNLLSLRFLSSLCCIDHLFSLERRAQAQNAD